MTLALEGSWYKYYTYRCSALTLASSAAAADHTSLVLDAADTTTLNINDWRLLMLAQ